MTRPDGRRWLLVAGLLAVALLPRLGVARGDALSYDDATVGLVAKHYLEGEAFPAFFYRQAYMGALNGIHLAPALFFFGPSIWLLRLNAIAWSLLFPLLLYVLGRRLFDEPTAHVALGLAAVPPFLLTELYVYEDLGPRPDASAGPDGPAVAAALAPHGVRRLLADPAISARVAEATRVAVRIRPANGFLDNHGRYLPLARLAERVRLRPGDAALVPEEDMDELRARLGEAGLRFREDPSAITASSGHSTRFPRRRRVGGRRGP